MLSLQLLNRPSGRCVQASWNLCETLQAWAQDPALQRRLECQDAELTRPGGLCACARGGGRSEPGVVGQVVPEWRMLVAGRGGRSSPEVPALQASPLPGPSPLPPLPHQPGSTRTFHEHGRMPRARLYSCGQSRATEAALLPGAHTLSAVNRSYTIIAAAAAAASIAPCPPAQPSRTPTSARSLSALATHNCICSLAGTAPKCDATMLLPPVPAWWV